MSWSLRILAGRNLLWTCGEQAIRVATSFLIGVWLARHLGPSALGLIAFALSIVALPQPLVLLGLNMVVKREWLDKPDQAPELLAAVFLTRLVISLVLIAGLAAATLLFVTDDTLRLMLLLLSTTLVLPAFSTFELLFQNRFQSHRTVIVRITGASAALLLTLVLVFLRAPSAAFAVPYVLEAVLVSGGFLALFLWSSPGNTWWKGSLSLVLPLLRQGFLVLAAAMLWMFVLQADHYFIKGMMGADELGLYNAASRLDKMVQFFPTAAVAVFFPLLIGKRAEASSGDRELILFLRMLLVIALAFVAFATAAAPLLIPLLYGEPFSGAVSIWRIHAWTIPFIFLVAARRPYVVRHQLYISDMRVHFASAVLTLGCMFVLVGRYGTTGAAWAVVAGTFTNGLLFPLIDPALRKFTGHVASAFHPGRG
jgi:PST family polysaccharide transporter